MQEGPRFSQYDSSYVNIQNLTLSYILHPLINSKPITDQLVNKGKVISETRYNISGFPGKYPAEEKKSIWPSLTLKKLQFYLLIVSCPPQTIILNTGEF